MSTYSADDSLDDIHYDIVEELLDYDCENGASPEELSEVLNYSLDEIRNAGLRLMDWNRIGINAAWEYFPIEGKTEELLED